MKRSIIYALVSLFAVAFLSCETHTEPTPKPEPNADFEVTINETTRGSVSFDVVPANLDMDYLCVIYEKCVVEEFTRDQFWVENIFMELTSEASDKGKTLGEYMPEVVDRGGYS